MTEREYIITTNLQRIRDMRKITDGLFAYRGIIRRSECNRLNKLLNDLEEKHRGALTMTLEEL